MANTNEEKKRKTGKIKTLFQKVKRKFVHAPLSEECKTSYSKQKLSKEDQKKLNEKLLGAVIDNKTDEVKTYLKLGGDVDYKTKEQKNITDVWFAANSTLLIIASGLGYTEIVDELIINGANVNIKNQVGNTALVWPADKGYFKICKLLIEKGASANIPNKNGWTTLMSAAQKGYFDICKLLVNHGANVNIQDKNGNTALMLAIGFGRSVTIKYLLSVGANPLLKDTTGQTTYDWMGKCDWREKEEINQILKKYMKLWKLIGEENATQIQQSVRNCEPDKVEGIIKNL